MNESTPQLITQWFLKQEAVQTVSEQIQVFANYQKTVLYSAGSLCADRSLFKSSTGCWSSILWELMRLHTVSMQLRAKSDGLL